MVTDTVGLISTDTATVTVSNLAPTAQAGGPYSGDEGASVALDGSGSSDPAGGDLAYAWDLDDDGQFDDAFTATPSYAWPEPGTYSLTLQVTDSGGMTNTAASQVTVNNVAPAAEGGGPYSGDEASSIMLDGSGSSDPGGGALTYAWDLDDDGQYDDAYTVNTSYSWTEPGIYQVSLMVTDTVGLTNSDVATVTVSNLAPTAVISGPLTGTAGGILTFDGSQSSDPGGGSPLSFGWEFDGDDDFDDAAGESVHRSFYYAGVYTIGLRVADTQGAQGFDTFFINISPEPWDANLVYLPMVLR
jgi:PKD repeat protein